MKEIWQINIMCDSEQYPFAFVKDMEISGQTCVSDSGSVSILILWEWYIGIYLFEGYTC